MTDYVFTHLKQEIVISDLVTVHYYEYDADFFFPGETHNFWELLYVDKGQVEVQTPSATHELHKGDIIFHKPMEFHNLRAVETHTPNLVVVAFDCHSEAMSYFEGKKMRLGTDCKDLLASIITEAGDAFSSRLDDPDLRQLERRDQSAFGAEQMIKLSLERLLLQLIRQEDLMVSAYGGDSSLIQEQAEQDAFAKVVAYLERNIPKRITLDDVCRDNLYGRSYLQKVFREKSGGGVMEYYGKLKIESAKRQIRGGTKNFTQIANDLGYASIHYFSRHFKKVSGMTPTEYASSVKVLTDRQKGRPVFFYK